MDLKEAGESTLPDADGWTWYCDKDNQYRMKKFNGSCWYGFKVYDESGNIKANPTIINRRCGVTIINESIQYKLPSFKDIHPTQFQAPDLQNAHSLVNELEEMAKESR